MPNWHLKAQGSGGAGQGGEGPSCEFSVTIDQHGLATVNNLEITGICNKDRVQRVLLAPNPAQNELSIALNQAPLDPSISIRIVNSTGHLVKSLTLDISEGRANLSLAELPNGFYFCSIRTDGAVLPAQKLIIQR